MPELEEGWESEGSGSGEGTREAPLPFPGESPWRRRPLGGARAPRAAPAPLPAPSRPQSRPQSRPNPGPSPGPIPAPVPAQSRPQSRPNPDPSPGPIPAPLPAQSRPNPGPAPCPIPAQSRPHSRPSPGSSPGSSPGPSPDPIPGPIPAQLPATILALIPATILALIPAPIPAQSGPAPGPIPVQIPAPIPVQIPAQSRPQSRSQSRPNPGPNPSPAPGPNPGPSPGPIPAPIPALLRAPIPVQIPAQSRSQSWANPGPNPGSAPGPGPWLLPRSGALPALSPALGAGRDAALREAAVGPPPSNTVQSPALPVPRQPRPCGKGGPQPQQRPSRVSEAVGSRLAPLYILRDFSSHRQLAKAQGGAERHSSAWPGGTCKTTGRAAAGLELEPSAGTARTAPALPQKRWGSPGGPHALYPHSRREAGLLLRAGSGSAPAGARTGPGRHGPKQPPPWGEGVPAPPPQPPGPRPGSSARRSSRKRRHGFGRSAAAVLASSLSLFAHRREGRIRPLRPAGMLGSGGAGTGALRCGVAGEGAPRRHRWPSRPRGPCVKSRHTRATWPSFGGIYREFAGRAREAAQAASLSKSTINRFLPQEQGRRERHDSQDRPQRPDSALEAAEGRRCPIHRQKAAGSFLLSSPPLPAPRDDAYARHPPPAVASLPRPGHPSSIPLTDGTATKSHQTSNNAARDNPEAWGRSAGRGRQPGQRAFPHRINRRAGSGPRLGQVRGRGQKAGKAQAAGTVPPYPRGPATGRSALGSRGTGEGGTGGTPDCRRQSPTEKDTAGRSRGQLRPLPPPGLSQAAQPEKGRRSWAAAGAAPVGQHRLLPLAPAGLETLGVTIRTDRLKDIQYPLVFQFRPPPERERTEETGLLLLTSDLRQGVPAGNESEGARRAAAHSNIHLQKEHPIAAPFPPLPSLKREIEGDKKNDPRTGWPPHNRSGRTSEAAPVRSGSRWAKSPGGAAPGPRPGTARPRTAAGRASPPPAEPAIPAEPGLPRRARLRPSESPPAHPTPERSPTAGPCR
ncbi:collagen alpha-1(I) chain-like [Poecile atricapillus]|uniref:collagen alpha-1(I) chain-like n=1 Tax=Poecile atricapillus TaxID=48891 RepID=UPI002738254D|nr:collagen alpha-1(I) chain-like [Poecile atricapillus]